MRKMKDSRIEWIGDIPYDWKLLRLKNVAEKFCNGSSETQLSSGESEYPVTRIETISKGIIDYTKVGYVNYLSLKYKLEKYDFLISNINSISYLGNCAIFLGDKKLYHGMNLLRITPSSINIWYLYYYFKSLCFKRNMQIICKPAINQASVSSSNIKNMYVPFPNMEEQQKIASYLDKKCSEIDALVTDIQNEIETLGEYKKSLVFHTISKGIGDRNLKQTVSDVWTYIPENWELIDIKYLFEIVKRIAGQEGFEVLSVTQKGLKVKDIESNSGQQAECYSGYQFVYPTDYVMNHMDLLTGWIDCSTMFGVTSPDYRVFRLRDKENNDLTYFKYVMQCCYMSRIFYSLGQGVSNLGRWRLQTSAFNNFIIPVPPFDEQKEIALYLDKKITEIDTIIADKCKQIKTIEEYKKSLIYEYVTGKKEVI